LGGTRSTESWRLLKSLRQDNKRDIISPITLEKWDDYFSKLLKENRPHFQIEDQTSTIQTTASPIRINYYRDKKYL